MVPGNDWLLPDWGPDPSSGAPHWGDGGPMSAGQVLLPALPGNQLCLIYLHHVCTQCAVGIIHVIIIFLWYKTMMTSQYKFTITVEMKIGSLLSN